jgi:hypothetical protein
LILNMALVLRNPYTPRKVCKKKKKKKVIYPILAFMHGAPRTS